MNCENSIRNSIGISSLGQSPKINLNLTFRKGFLFSYLNSFKLFRNNGTFQDSNFAIGRKSFLVKNNNSKGSGDLILFKSEEEPQTRFFNQCFDKGRLKNFVLWFLLNYGENKTVQLVEQLKNTGFYYASKAGISLGIDDLKIPPKKQNLIYEAESQTNFVVNKYLRGEITGVERFQGLIDIWHRTSELLKHEVINYFEMTDILNPVYMMAFSGARGNISQVRQLVGMRGLMSDPQGQIIEFPIRSNFREGLTLTEYIISSYGARKGIVDTALRTANAGYLTRRLVDVAQHVIISNLDCGTKRGIFLTNMKEGNKTIHSLSQRIVGRILGRDLLKMSDNSIKIASRNDEVTLDLAYEISKNFDKVFVRSSLTCETPKQICQLCYGWSLAQGRLVSIGEAVGVVAAQSIGEPGTQLTMRTFHTGGVFSGDISDQVKAPFDGIVEYVSAIPGTLIRTPEGKIAFLTKSEGAFFVHERIEQEPLLQAKVTDKKIIDKSNQTRRYKIPYLTLLYIKNGEEVNKKDVIAQITSISRRTNATDEAELVIKSDYEGQFYSKSLGLHEKEIGPKMQSILNPGNFETERIYESWTWGYAWILSGKIYELRTPTQIFPKLGDFMGPNSNINKINWKINPSKGNMIKINFEKRTPMSLSFLTHPFPEEKGRKKNNPSLWPLLTAKALPFPERGKPSLISEDNIKRIPLQSSQILCLDLHKITYKKLGYFFQPAHKIQFFTSYSLKQHNLYKGYKKNVSIKSELNTDLIFLMWEGSKNINFDKFNNKKNILKKEKTHFAFDALKTSQKKFPYLLQWFPIKNQTISGGCFIIETIKPCYKHMNVVGSVNFSKNTKQAISLSVSKKTFHQRPHHPLGLPIVFATPFPVGEKGGESKQKSGLCRGEFNLGLNFYIFTFPKDGKKPKTNLINKNGVSPNLRLLLGFAPLERCKSNGQVKEEKGQMFKEPSFHKILWIPSMFFNVKNRLFSSKALPPFGPLQGRGGIKGGKPTSTLKDKTILTNSTLPFLNSFQGNQVKTDLNYTFVNKQMPMLLQSNLQGKIKGLDWNNLNQFKKLPAKARREGNEMKIIDLNKKTENGLLKIIFSKHTSLPSGLCRDGSKERIKKILRVPKEYKLLSFNKFNQNREHESFSNLSTYCKTVGYLTSNLKGLSALQRRISSRFSLSETSSLKSGAGPSITKKRSDKLQMKRKFQKMDAPFPFLPFSFPFPSLREGRGRKGKEKGRKGNEKEGNPKFETEFNFIKKLFMNKISKDYIGFFSNFTLLTEFKKEKKEILKRYISFFLNYSILIFTLHPSLRAFAGTGQEQNKILHQRHSLWNKTGSKKEYKFFISPFLDIEYLKMKKVKNKEAYYKFMYSRFVNIIPCLDINLTIFSTIPGPVSHLKSFVPIVGTEKVETKSMFSGVLKKGWVMFLNNFSAFQLVKLHNKIIYPGQNIVKNVGFNKPVFTECFLLNKSFHIEYLPSSFTFGLNSKIYLNNGKPPFGTTKTKNWEFPTYPSSLRDGTGTKGNDINGSLTKFQPLEMNENSLPPFGPLQERDEKRTIKWIKNGKSRFFRESFDTSQTHSDFCLASPLGGRGRAKATHQSPSFGRGKTSEQKTILENQNNDSYLRVCLFIQPIEEYSKMSHLEFKKYFYSHSVTSLSTRVAKLQKGKNRFKTLRTGLFKKVKKKSFLSDSRLVSPPGGRDPRPQSPSSWLANCKGYWRSQAKVGRGKPRGRSAIVNQSFTSLSNFQKFQNILFNKQKKTMFSLSKLISPFPAKARREGGGKDFSIFSHSNIIPDQYLNLKNFTPFSNLIRSGELTIPSGLCRDGTNFGAKLQNRKSDSNNKLCIDYQLGKDYLFVISRKPLNLSPFLIGFENFENNFVSNANLSLSLNPEKLLVQKFNKHFIPSRLEARGKELVPAKARPVPKVGRAFDESQKIKDSGFNPVNYSFNQFEGQTYLLSYSPILKLDSFIYPFLSQKLGHICDFYLSKIQKQPFSTFAGPLQGVEEITILKNGTAPPNIAHLIPNAFESPCFAFFVETMLDTYSLQDNKRKNKKTNYFYTASSFFGTNEILPTRIFAETRYGSPYIGEVVYKQNAKKRLFSLEDLPISNLGYPRRDGTSSLSVGLETKRKTDTLRQAKASLKDGSIAKKVEEPSWNFGCMFLTKNDIASFYLPSKNFKEILHNFNYIKKQNYEINNIHMKFINMASSEELLPNSDFFLASPPGGRGRAKATHQSPSSGGGKLPFPFFPYGERGKERTNFNLSLPTSLRDFAGPLQRNNVFVNALEHEDLNKNSQIHISNLDSLNLKPFFNQETNEIPKISLSKLKAGIPAFSSSYFSLNTILNQKIDQLLNNDRPAHQRPEAFAGKDSQYRTISNPIPLLGDFFMCGDPLDATTTIPISGQLIHYNNNKITLRRGQPILISPKAVIHKLDGDFIDPKTPVITLSYQKLKTGDIIQGIPKVEQFFEARTTKRGRLFRDSLPSLLKALFNRYKSKMSFDLAVRQSFYKIQQIIVDGVQRVYKSQGVTIADKHLEVIVKQMTSKVRILDGAQTGFFPGEIVDLLFVEKINLYLIKKITYEPLVLGITRASLEVDSFLSASSFQQTTRVLSQAAIYRKKDFLKGLKENIILGNLIPAGTGYLVSQDTAHFPFK